MHSFCSLARHLTDALSRNEIGLSYLSNLPSQPSAKLPSIETLLTSCEVLQNQLALDNFTPYQQPTSEQSSVFLQNLAGDETALPLAKQLLFTVRSSPQTRDVMPQWSAARRLEDASNTDTTFQTFLPLSGSNIQSNSVDAASMPYTAQFGGMNDADTAKGWPFMGHPILSDPILGPMLQPRDVGRGSVVVGGLLLTQRRTLPPSSPQRRELCSSRFAASLSTSCADSVPVRLGSTEITSQGQYTDVRLESGGGSWIPGWLRSQMGTPAAPEAGGMAAWGSDSAYLPHSTLFSSEATLQKELFYDTRKGSDEIGPKGTPYGFFLQDSSSPQDDFSAVFPVRFCQLFAQFTTHTCFRCTQISSCAVGDHCRSALVLFCSRAQRLSCWIFVRFEMHIRYDEVSYVPEFEQMRSWHAGGLMHTCRQQLTPTQWLACGGFSEMVASWDLTPIK